MRYSSFTSRIDGEGAAAWDSHNRAVEMSRQGKEIIMLSMGDPDFDTPSLIVEAAISSLRAGDTHYTDFKGEPALREIIAAQHQNTTGQQATLDNIIIMAGAQCSLYCAANCVLEYGDEVIVPEPTYVTYEAVIGTTGARTVAVAMDPNNNFRLNPADIEAAVTDKTRAIMLNTPHNPTGAALNIQDLEAIANIGKKYDLWVISDEVYASIVFDREHYSIASIPGMEDRIIVINSLSKSHAMTGWRLGWIIGPEKLIDHVCNVVTCMLYGCPTFIQQAAITALTCVDADVSLMKNNYQERRDLVYKRLNAVPGLYCHLPAGGLFMMIDIRQSALSAQAFAELLLERYNVSTLAGEAFGPSAAGHIRISLGVSCEQLARACDRIESCFKRVMTEKLGISRSR